MEGRYGSRKIKKRYTETLVDVYNRKIKIGTYNIQENWKFLQEMLRNSEFVWIVKSYQASHYVMQ